MTHQAKILDVKLLDQYGQPAKIIKSGDTILLSSTIEFYEDAPSPHFSCFVHDGNGRLIYDQTTLWQGLRSPNFFQGQISTIIYELKFNTVAGIYHIGMDIHYTDLSCYYDRIESAVSVVVEGGNGAKGIADLNCCFKFDHPSITNFPKNSQ